MWMYMDVDVYACRCICMSSYMNVSLHECHLTRMPADMHTSLHPYHRIYMTAHMHADAWACQFTCMSVYMHAGFHACQLTCVPVVPDRYRFVLCRFHCNLGIGESWRPPSEARAASSLAPRPVTPYAQSPQHTAVKEGSKKRLGGKAAGAAGVP